MQDLYKIQGIVNIRKGEGRTLKQAVCGYMIMRLKVLPEM